MTATVEIFMGNYSHIGRAPNPQDRPRDRLQRFLAARCANPKSLAREAEITTKAAENALNGHWPGDLTFQAIVKRFGADVWEAVFLPDIAPLEARLLAELEEGERYVAERRARLRAAAGAARAADILGAPGASDLAGGEGRRVAVRAVK